ncbi:MAG: hypothetical protein CSB21_03845 [Deltaproteobacteria bacterium]|nr:MAG: hypothetical protein CSB21_03845 [Deltaproteobacteria bacterium]
MKSLKLFKKLIVISCILIFFVFSGCNDNNQKNSIKESNHDKVSKRINLPVKENVSGKSFSKNKKASVNGKNTDTHDSSLKNQSEKPRKINEIISKKVISDLVENSNVSDMDDISQINVANLYSDAGRINPFTPLVKESVKKKDVKVSGSGEKKIERPKTPLEKFALSQLRLVAVMTSPEGRFAVLEESSGKGYIVDKGTYVGLNSGQITAIEPEQIIIAETIENITGKSLKRERILKIQKSSGE